MKRAIPFGSLLALLAAALPVAAEPLDRELYARLLQRHTRETADLARVRVDYAALRGAAEWRRLRENVARTDPDALGTRSERLAYWIDVYNILAIDRVVRGDPEQSIRDLGSLFSSVWKQEAARIRGRSVSLDEIEHRILRPMGEPRIHAAIVCASLSCPALSREPFAAETLDAQLDAVARRWLADRDKGLRIDRENGRVMLSRIFEWFEADFEGSGGPLGFAARYAPPEARAWLEQRGGRVEIRYFDYDWALNDLARAGPGGAG